MGKLSQQAKDRLWYLEQIKGDECLCGRTKKPRQAVCFTCWRRLPRDLQRRLYSRLGEGFEEAFDEAAQYIDL